MPLHRAGDASLWQSLTLEEDRCLASDADLSHQPPRSVLEPQPDSEQCQWRQLQHSAWLYAHQCGDYKERSLVDLVWASSVAVPVYKHMQEQCLRSCGVPWASHAHLCSWGIPDRAGAMRSCNVMASAAGGTKEATDSPSLASTALELCSSAGRMWTDCRAEPRQGLHSSPLGWGELASAPHLPWPALWEVTGRLS